MRGRRGSADSAHEHAVGQQQVPVNVDLERGIEAMLDGKPADLCAPRELAMRQREPAQVELPRAVRGDAQVASRRPMLHTITHLTQKGKVKTRQARYARTLGAMRSGRGRKMLDDRQDGVDQIRRFFGQPLAGSGPQDVAMALASSRIVGLGCHGAGQRAVTNRTTTRSLA